MVVFESNGSSKGIGIEIPFWILVQLIAIWYTFGKKKNLFTNKYSLFHIEVLLMQKSTLWNNIYLHFIYFSPNPTHSNSGVWFIYVLTNIAKPYYQKLC